MQIIYQSTITLIGEQAALALDDEMLILFREGAPADVCDYCFIHSHGELNGDLRPGVSLDLADAHYTLTAVGEVAQQNLQQLGHITLRFDGAQQAEYPGCVHVAGEIPRQLPVGSVIRFFTE